MSYMNSPEYAASAQEANEWALECKKIKEEKQSHLREEKPEKPPLPPAAEESIKFHKALMTEAHKEFCKTLFKQYLAGGLTAEKYKESFRKATERGDAMLDDIEHAMRDD